MFFKWSFFAYIRLLLSRDRILLLMILLTWISDTVRTGGSRQSLRGPKKIYTASRAAASLRMGWDGMDGWDGGSKMSFNFLILCMYIGFQNLMSSWVL